MADDKSYQEKDVESAQVQSVTEEPQWRRNVRRIERSLGVEAQGVTRVHEGGLCASIPHSVAFSICASLDQRDHNAKGWQAAEVWLS
jgi:hypothetical protein